MLRIVRGYFVATQILQLVLNPLTTQSTSVLTSLPLTLTLFQTLDPKIITMSFLELPLEMRYQVYDYMTIPHTEPSSNDHGNYLSCHQIKDEMESECRIVFGCASC
jgi:hypothetical protein